MSYSKPAEPISWAGGDYKRNSLTGRGKFNPRIPAISAERNAEKELIWQDCPPELSKRLKNKDQLITADCLKENAEAILKFYEKDIINYVVEGQVKSRAVRTLILRDYERKRQS